MAGRGRSNGKSNRSPSGEPSASGGSVASEQVIGSPPPLSRTAGFNITASHHLEEGGVAGKAVESEVPDDLIQDPPPLEPRKAFLERLKDYKELIAIVVACITGVIWLYVAFATKAHVATVRCLLGATIERVEHESISKDADRNIIGKSAKLEELKRSGRADASYIVESETLKQEIENHKDAKKRSDDTVRASSKKILECDS